MSKLPPGWEWTTLGEVSESTVGQQGPQAERFNYIDISSIDTATKRITEPKWLCVEAAPSRARQNVKKADVLVSLTRPNLNAIARVSSELDGAVASTGFHVLRTAEVDPNYIYFFAQCRMFVERLVSRVQGVVYPAVRPRDVAEIRLPLPSLPEQRRIVAEIEKQFTRLDQADVSIVRVRKELNRFRASILKKATVSKPHWSEVRIGDIADIGTGATPKRDNPLYWSGGTIPWVTSAAVNRDEITEPSSHVTQEALDKTNLTVYPAGTLLLAMYGEGKTRGKVSSLKIAAATNQALAAIQVRATSYITTDFLRIVLLERYIDTRSMSSGGVQPNLNLGLVRSIRIGFPPCQREQSLVVDGVERSLSVIAKIQSTLNSSLARGIRLRQAILAKAFSGQLVPQDPNDEPASVLLERIRAERGASGGPRPKRSVRKRSQ